MNADRFDSLPSTRPILSERSEPKGSARSGEATAETAYYFRHALLRDAAYQLQMPRDRARLHALALEAIEQVAGGRAPGRGPLKPGDGSSLEAHPTDSFAEDLADHARLAGSSGEFPVSEELLSAQGLYLRRAAEYAESRFRLTDAARLWSLFAGQATGIERGEALRRAAVSSVKAGRPRVAEPLFQQAIAILQGAGDRRSSGIAIGNLALLYQETGRMELAEARQQEAIAIHRETGNRAGEGNSLGNLAIVFRDTGRDDLARNTFSEALAIHRELGDRRMEGLALSNLAIQTYELGQAEPAERGFNEALAIYREIRDRRAEGVAMGGLGVLHRDAERFELAEQFLTESLAIHREVGNRRFEGNSLANLAILYCKTRRPGVAERAFEEAIAIDREVSDRRTEGAHLCDYAMFLLAEGRVEEAREAFRSGVSLLRQVGDTATLTVMLRRIGAACAEAGVPSFLDKLNAEGKAAFEAATAKADAKDWAGAHEGLQKVVDGYKGLPVEKDAAKALAEVVKQEKAAGKK